MLNIHVKLGALALMGAASATWAEDLTLLRFQVSTNGVSWSNSVEVAPGRAQVQVRATVTFTGDSFSAPLGFASIAWQPTVANWAPGRDSLLPWADHGSNANGGSVPDLPGADAPYGRIVPFASSGPSSSDPYFGHSQTVAGVRYLRIARSSITNWVGAGPTSGTLAFNNFNGSGGIISSQRAWGNVGPRDPLFSSVITDCVLLKLGFSLDTILGNRTLVIDAPSDGIGRNPVTGAREASWYASQSDTFGQIKGRVVVETASIVVVPAPTGITLILAVTGAAWCRRRTRPASL